MKTLPGEPDQANDGPEAGTSPDQKRASPRRGIWVTVPRIASAGPWSIRLRAPAPVLQGLIALTIYVLVWFFGWAMPLVEHARTNLLNQGSMDPNFYLWSLRWWPYALGHGTNPLFTRELGAPLGFNLAWTTTVPPLALAAVPLTLLAGSVMSFNLLVAIAPPVSAWAAFIACRRLTGKFWPALFGAACYGFSAYEINHGAAGQLNLIWNVLPPLIVYLVIVWRDGKLGRAWFVALMALLLAIQLFLYLETFFQLTVLIAIGLPVGYALAGRSGRPVVARLGRQLAAAYGFAIVVASPYLLYALRHYPTGFTRSPAVTGLNLGNLVIPRVGRTFDIGWLTQDALKLPSYSDAGYVGIAALLAVLLVAIWTWSSKITRFVVIMFVVIVALAAGPVLNVGTDQVGSVPWSRLWFLPVARSALPNRFMMLGGLALAVLVAIFLAAAPRRGKWLQFARWPVVFLAVFAILADVPTVADTTPPENVRVPAFFATGEFRHFIKPGDTVVVISTRGNAGMLFQGYTNFYMRIAGGYINMAITPRTDLPTEVQDLAHADRQVDRRFIAFLKAAHVQAILVEQDWQPAWIGILGRLGLRHQTVGGILVYRIGPCVTSCAAPHHHHDRAHSAKLALD